MAGTRSTGRRYAEAAFQVAERDGTIAEWLTALDDAASLLDDPDLARLLASPAIPVATRQELLGKVAAGRIAAAPMRSCRPAATRFGNSLSSARSKMCAWR